jgi:curved DNA-binding protein CbpA
MIGQLNDYPLAELIREISSLNLSGALRLSRERAKVVIYFDAGELIYTASNLRVYRLSECVRRWGALTAEQLTRTQSATSDLEFGNALLESGALSRDALNELMTRQVSEMLCHALLWLDGEWEYDPRVRLAADLRADINMKELLMESARRLPADLVASRLRGRDGNLSIEVNTNNSLALLPTEAFVLSRVDSSLALNELLALGGLPEAETLCLIYTLAMGGFLSFDNWPKALTDTMIAQARSVISSKAEPAQALPSLKESAVESKPKSEPEPEEEYDEIRELDALFSRLEIATNFYQILSVVRPAKDADIKRAYHSLAKRFHPDRYRKTVDEQVHARVEAAFAKIAQAYDVLKDKRTRATYDSKLLKQEEMMRSVNSSAPAKASGQDTAASVDSDPAKTAATQSKNKASQYQAEEKFQQGLTALRSGNSAVAISCLGDAARLEPQQPRYRAYFGQALASDERMRRNAETEFKAAISLDANNAAYRVMLAELYNQIGLPRRAQAELERALIIDPKNQVARRLLDKVKQ